MLPSGVAEEVKLHLTGPFLYYYSSWLKAKLIKKTEALRSKELWLCFYAEALTLI